MFVLLYNNILEPEPQVLMDRTSASRFYEPTASVSTYVLQNGYTERIISCTYIIFIIIVNSVYLSIVTFKRRNISNKCFVTCLAFICINKIFFFHFFIIKLYGIHLY